MDFIGSTVVYLPIVFSSTPEPVVPDLNSVTFSVYNQIGEVLLADEPIVTTGTSFRTTAVIPLMYNNIPSGSLFARRNVVVTFNVDGATYNKTISYRLIPNLPHSVTADEIRAFLGVNTFELGDEDIDIVSSYFAVQEVLTEPVMTLALTSGGYNELRVNDMVRMRSAMMVIPSLKHRVAQQEKNGVKSFTRPAIKTFDDLMAAALARYNDALGLVVGVDLGAQYTLIVVTQDVDPVTGA